MQKCFSGSDTAQREALVIENAADPLPRATRKRTRKFLRDDVEEKDIVLDLKQLSKRSVKKTSFTAKKYSNEEGKHFEARKMRER